MSQQVEVVVFSGDRQVDGPLARPVRRLPTGRAGIVYGGEVYPLHAGDRIELTDPTFDKSACATYVERGAPIPYAVSTRHTTVSVQPTSLLADQDWYVETSRFGHYLVFDADEQTAGQVVDLVDDAGLVVRRWDSSHRPADDGRSYDWFVRLGFDGDREACVRILGNVLRGSPAAEPALTGLPEGLQRSVVKALEKALVVARDNTRLGNEIERLGEELAARSSRIDAVQLQAEADAASFATAADGLRAQVAAHDRNRRSLLDAHERQVATLRSEVAEALAVADNDQAATIAADRDRILDEYVEADQKLTEMTTALATREREVAGLQAQLVQLQGRLAEVKDADRERATAAREAHQGNRIPRNGADAFIQKVLGRCSLDADSIELLLELRRADKMMRELIRVNDNADDLRTRSKKVQGYAGWWEIPKINIGARKAMGRLYYRHTSDGDVEVHVHDKDDNSEQRRFLERKLV
jgi:hypothetical protein